MPSHAPATAEEAKYCQAVTKTEELKTELRLKSRGLATRDRLDLQAEYADK